MARTLSSCGEGGGEGVDGVLSRGGKIPCLRNASLLDKRQTTSMVCVMDSQFCIFVGVHGKRDEATVCALRHASLSL